METSSVQQQEQLFQKFESYDFGADANFQDRQETTQTGGSSAPISTTSEPIEEESQSSSNDAAPASDPSYPKSFQEICELIASGKPIPGIRQIPNNLAEGTPSEAKLAPKLKPWEKKKAVDATATAIAAAQDETTPAPAEA
ncbi:hypothetical protein BGX24_005688 [Mortierella sp. AD032]|nr:hypothetical protein BGX24_005688 [Mortierella sp. AD032]